MKDKTHIVSSLRYTILQKEHKKGKKIPDDEKSEKN